MKKRWLILLFLASLYSCSTRKPEVRLLITGKEDFPGIYGENKIEYEKVYGLFTGEVDIDDPHNAIITDRVWLNEMNAEWQNIRQNFLSSSQRICRWPAVYYALMLLTGGNAYGARPDSLFLARGYIFLSGAWQGDVKRRENETPGYRLYLDVPIAKNKDGSPLTGIVRVEFASFLF
jgi:hypothetical protein